MVKGQLDTDVLKILKETVHALKSTAESSLYEAASGKCLVMK